MDSYIIPIAVLAGLWYIANKHSQDAEKTLPLPTAKHGIIPLAQLPRDPIAESSIAEIAPRGEQPVSGALGFGIASLGPKQVNPWANMSSDFF